MLINKKSKLNTKKQTLALLITLIIGVVTIPFIVQTLTKPQKIQQEAQTAAIPQPNGVIGNWNITFQDEFEGSSLDTNKWSICYPWDCHSAGNEELMVYDPKYATVNNEELTITAVKQNTCDGSYCANYGSSLIQTGKSKTGNPAKFLFTYGFVEAKLQVPFGTGYFPAFWLLGGKSEIDLMEVFGNKTKFDCGVHLNSYKNHWGCDKSSAIQNTPGSYHTFGLDWQPDHLTFYYDGQPVGSTTDQTKIPSDPMYILLNFAIGANFMPPPDSTTVFPAALKADYIRVWKKSDSPIAPTFACMGGMNCNPTPTPMTTSNNNSNPNITTAPNNSTVLPSATENQHLLPTTTLNPTIPETSSGTIEQLINELKKLLQQLFNLFMGSPSTNNKYQNDPEYIKCHNGIDDNKDGLLDCEDHTCKKYCK